MARPSAAALYQRRKQTVEPGFGIIAIAMRFTRLRPRGFHIVTTEWTPVARA